MLKRDPSTQVRAVDLFCGAGGSSRGAAMAGVTPVAALDMWELATRNYKLNFPEATTYNLKASELTPRRLSKDPALDLTSVGYATERS